MNRETNLPKSYWVISIIGLIWNLMGCFNCYLEYTYWSNPDSRSVLGPDLAAMYDTMPMWMYIIFAVAVTTGTLGCIGLLMRKSWAVPLFLVSWISVIVQMGYFILASGILKIKGPTAVIMPILVIMIAAFLYFYAKGSKAKGWLS